MTYKILQLKKENRRKYGFMSYDFAKENNFNLDDYEKVYEGETYLQGSTERTLDKLFQIFNIDRPKDFKGHSLSTSDIIVLGEKKFYCDFIGWVEL